jgi:hypothetical protein
MLPTATVIAGQKVARMASGNRLARVERNVSRPSGGFAAVLAVAAVLACTGTATGSGELVQNGLLSSGYVGTPTGWERMAYFETPDAIEFRWLPADSGVGVLKISNFKADDGRWVQKIPVVPSHWYRASAWIRTEEIGQPVTGAYLMDMYTGAMSADLRGTTPWQLVEFWFKTMPGQKQVELACRLGGYSALNHGTAYFTAISLMAFGGFPQDAERVYGASVFDFPTERAIIFSSAMILIATAILLWRFVMGTVAVSVES